MPDSNTFRVASFNVENLFSRARVFNFRDHSIGDDILDAIEKFRALLRKDVYSTEDKELIFEAYQALKEYIEVREDRGKLWQRLSFAITGVQADGQGDWDGTIEFKQEKLSEVERENTARVIKEVRSDLACIVEAESRPILRAFDSEMLNNRYRYEMLIDGNDQRGIDVAVYSKFPLGGLWTHIFDRVGNSAVFSRDCLEVETLLPNGKSLFLLCNHFKSRGYDPNNTADGRRKRQAERVAQILQARYDLINDWVIVAGDFNDDPGSDPLQPILSVQHLHDVLQLQFPTNPNKRWTYHYNKFEQIDYILVSEPLKAKFEKAGVERRGIYDLKTLTESSNDAVDIEQEFATVTHWRNAASDHGAVWAEFRL